MHNRPVASHWSIIPVLLQMHDIQGGQEMRLILKLGTHFNERFSFIYSLWSIIACTLQIKHRILCFVTGASCDFTATLTLYRIAFHSGAKKHLSDTEFTTFRSWARPLSVAIIPLKMAFLKGTDRCFFTSLRKAIRYSVNVA
jgi:hypothetical protein